MDPPITEKANQVLHLIFLLLFLIVFRVGYLGLLKHEESLEKSRKPQTRVVVQPAERGTIEDRFGVPLAINKLSYRATLCYGPMRSLPRSRWVEGKRTYPRREYIEKFCNMLTLELGVPAQEVKDLIYAQAAIFPQTAFPVGSELSEEQYYRLKARERSWPGLEAVERPCRYYPRGKSACSVLGYLGAISDSSYRQLHQELKELRSYLAKRRSGEPVVLPTGYSSASQVRERIQFLEERAYTLHDRVGKSGLEAQFEQELKGKVGKKYFEVDFQGNLLRELPLGKKPVPGASLKLALSSAMQEKAEELLTRLESAPRKPPFNSWINGGAVVAMLPATGEIVALASYPRFNPNDLSNPEELPRWLESQSYIGDIWDGKKRLEKEIWDSVKEEYSSLQWDLTWESYLDTILSPDSAVRKAMRSIITLATAHACADAAEFLQQLATPLSFQCVLDLLYPTAPHIQTGYAATAEDLTLGKELLEQDEGAIAALKQALEPFLASIFHNSDKALLIDLCRLVVRPQEFSPALLSKLGRVSLEEIRRISCEIAQLKSALKQEIEPIFHQQEFATWRAAHFASFLKKKRELEEERHVAARPFTDYLKAAERGLFKQFWANYSASFVAYIISGHPSLLPPWQEESSHYLPMLETLQKSWKSQLSRETLSLLRSLPLNELRQLCATCRSFDDLNHPLFGRYRQLRNEEGLQRGKHLAAAFYPLYGYSYQRSFAFQQLAPQGSVFKLVTGYQGLTERYETVGPHASPSELNPLTLIDDVRPAPAVKAQQTLGYSLDGAPYARLHRGGRLPATSHAGVGKIDLPQALEHSSNIYFSILALEGLSDPSHLEEAAHLVGFGEKSGIELPYEKAGLVPQDVAQDRTGLYTLAIGQHSLLVTPLQTAMMTGCLANGGTLLQPHIIQRTICHRDLSDPKQLFHRRDYPYREFLEKLGFDFPLYTAALERSSDEIEEIVSSRTERRQIFLPPSIRKMLLTGMQRVILGEHGLGRPAIIRTHLLGRKAKNSYISLKEQIVGKTGTAEAMCKPWIDAESKAQLSNHTWFSAISFLPPYEGCSKEEMWQHPELVVVAYYRMGLSGGQLGPIIAELVATWRELQKEKR